METVEKDSVERAGELCYSTAQPHAALVLSPHAVGDVPSAPMPPRNSYQHLCITLLETCRTPR